MAGMTISQIKQACFLGDRDRDCDYCPAHPSKGGDCCFGTLHEYDDPSPSGCQSCRHEQECAPITHGHYPPHGEPPEEEEEASRRVILNRGSVNRPVSTTNTRLPIIGQPPQSSWKKPQGARPQQYPTTEQALSILTQYGEPVRTPIPFTEKASFGQKLATVTLWGMAEGGLEMALRFFRIRRPG